MATTNAINHVQISQNGSEIYAASATGNDTYVVTLAPVPTAYVNGMTINIKPDTANTGAATLNVNSLGAIAITKQFNQPLVTGDILANQVITVVYNSTGPTFQMQSQSARIPITQTGAEIFGTDSVGSDAYAVTLVPAPSAYATGMVVNFKAGTANTGAATLNVNSLGAITIKKNNDQDLATGDIESGQMVTVIYDGTNFQMQSQLAQTSTVTGTILQVTQTTKTDTFTTTSTSATDITGMSASITPTSTSNKVLVLIHISATLNGSNSYFINLLRGVTQIYMGDAASNRVRTTIFSRGQNAEFPCAMTICYLDSPSTTSATTYKLQGYVESGTLNINRSNSDADNNAYGRSVSSITLMEVKG